MSESSEDVLLEQKRAKMAETGRRSKPAPGALAEAQDDSDEACASESSASDDQDGEPLAARLPKMPGAQQGAGLCAAALELSEAMRPAETPSA
jgi:hypothetical protein